MKKIIFINCTDIGSTGEVIRLTAKYIASYGWESILCTPSIHSKGEPFLRFFKVSFPYEQGVYRRISSFFNNIYGFAPISTNRILKIIKKEKPDIVHIHCANGNMVNLYTLFRVLAKKNINTVITNHAEFYYTGYCPHSKSCDKWLSGCGNCPQVASFSFDATAKRWRQMKKAIQGIKNLYVSSVSPWVLERSSKSPIMDNVKQVLIENSVNNEIFKLCNETSLIKDYIKIFENKKVVFHVTAHFSNTKYDKAGAYIIELAKRFCNDDVVFVVAGPYSNVQDVPKNLVLLNRILDKNKLAQLYNYADLCVVTSERETFGMTVAESLCCGTPVVGFESGGSESIAIDEYCEFCDFGEVDQLEQLIRTKWLLFKNAQNKEQISKKAKECFNEEKMTMKYLNLYEQMRREHE